MCSSDLEARLLAGRIPAPSETFRDRVLLAMEGADLERRTSLRSHGHAAATPRILPEVIAGVAAALLVLLAAWPPGERAQPSSPAAALPSPAAASDVERSLELLEARRHRLLDLGIGVAGVAGGGQATSAAPPPRRT